MIQIVEEISQNYIAQAAFLGWFSAQAIKFLWQLIRHGQFRLERLIGSGGFPSSHTSFVISTTTALYLKNGVTDIFIVALVFSIVVMYDASGVRLEAGRQAQMINQIIDYFVKRNIPVVLKDRQFALKELLGHTPIEVFGGLILGIIVACIQYFYIYNGAL
ncbi:divergent PAP2 family protein [Veillonella agrestimuris]|uniref:divergent PAP2 family protein n=1 Tax=Veillonella agrestimuris TaxID=2941340 RepID=UPI00203D6571|nr:divergent PAP2 family protein [Veillonella agrestimuris]